MDGGVPHKPPGAKQRASSWRGSEFDIPKEMHGPGFQGSQNENIYRVSEKTVML